MSDITKIKVDGEPESSYQLYPRNNEFAKRAVGDGGSGVQSDWNQNDATKPDYVKNRPFYTGNPVETVLLEETTAEFTEKNSLYSYELSNPPSLEVGQTYQVSWDGTVYECVGTDFNGEGVALGNLSMVVPGAANTGEPFIYGFAEFYTQDTSASHTISISRPVDPIIKIDEKYLPELPYMDKESPTATGSFSLNRKHNTIVGTNSFAEGHFTTASGDISHAEGNGTTASGNTSHAEGHFTTASGFFSHAEGTETTASGYASHAEGISTKASSSDQHAQGKYNIEDSSGTYAHIVGNGDSDTVRSNAHTLDWSGNAWFAGDVYVGSTSGTHKDAGSKKLATESTTVITTLSVSSWDSSTKTQTVSVSGVTAASNGSLRIAQSATDEQFTAWGAAQPRVTAQADGSITVKLAGTVPTIDIPVEVLIV